MAMEGSELGVCVSSVKKRVLVTEVHGWSWACTHPYLKHAVHPPPGHAHLLCVCDVVLQLLKDTQNYVGFSDLDQPDQ